MKELVLMVEGQGDIAAAGNLAVRMMERVHANSTPAFYVGNVMKVGDIYALLAPEKQSHQKYNTKLVRFLKAAENKPDLGAVLILLDGDAKKQRSIPTIEGPKEFCSARIGYFIVEQAMKYTQAGQTYSLAVVFANQEFESWILAGHPKLSEYTVNEPLEETPRDAKKRIWEITKQPYNEATDQIAYTRGIDIDGILQRKPEMRSFRRFDNAIREIDKAARDGVYVCTPIAKPIN